MIYFANFNINVNSYVWYFFIVCNIQIVIRMLKI